jgi:hypothetical protein
MFLFRGREAHSRSFAKAVSWRVTGTIDTFVIRTYLKIAEGCRSAISVE